jgi:hypothetical protein
MQSLPHPVSSTGQALNPLPRRGEETFFVRRMTVKKWEYKVVVLKDKEIEQKLNSFGDVGWELVAPNGFGTFYLKREISLSSGSLGQSPR